MPSAARNTPTRPVWLAAKTATHLERIAYDVDDELDKALLLQIAEQIYAAPADPAEAAEDALVERYGSSFADGTGGNVARVVLRALGGFPLETT